MAKVTVTPEIVQELVSYAPDTGTMRWRPRTPAQYKRQLPSMSDERARKLAQAFNRDWAGAAVGTDVSNQGARRRVRFAFGTGIKDVRINSLTVAWWCATGKRAAPNCQITTWDGDPRNTKADNIIETTYAMLYVICNPSSGISQRATGRWTWALRDRGERLHGVREGYATKAEARRARDEMLRERDCYYMRRLSDILDG